MITSPSSRATEANPVKKDIVVSLMGKRRAERIAQLTSTSGGKGYVHLIRLDYGGQFRNSTTFSLLFQITNYKSPIQNANVYLLEKNSIVCEAATKSHHIDTE